MTIHLSRPHAILGCLAVLEAALDEVSDVDASYLGAPDKRAALLGLTSVGARVEELRLRVLAAGQALGDVADDDAARDAAAWLAHHAHLDPGRARHLARLGTGLERRWHLVAEALRAGRLDLEQAATICRALEELPGDLDAEVLLRAEARLVGDAGSFDPRRLRILGRRVLAVVAPGVAEDLEARALADEDAHAARTTFLHTRRRGDGTTDLHARISDTLAERLLGHLHAFTSPRRAHAGVAPGGGRVQGAVGHAPPADRRPFDQRLGTAFGAWLEKLDPSRSPVLGGDTTTVIVTIDLGTMRDELAGAGVALIGDTPISAAQARRLACTARIIPAVLGAGSEVLDLGRSRRLFGRSQRLAMMVRHPVCAAVGCDIPAPWCEAHHAGDPWSREGRTDLDQGALLCSHHHHRAHDPRYEATRHADGSMRFHRRT